MRGSAAPARPDRSAIRTRRRVHLTMSPAAVWEALHRLDAYRRWWPWLEAFDGLALASGEQWRTTVRAPFGYRVRFAVDLTEVEPWRTVRATVSGDIVGSAGVETRSSEGGTDLVLVAELAASSRFLRLLMRLAPPVARRGHDLIIDQALRQFAAHQGGAVGARALRRG